MSGGQQEARAMEEDEAQLVRAAEQLREALDEVAKDYHGVKLSREAVLQIVNEQLFGTNFVLEVKP